MDIKITSTQNNIAFYSDIVSEEHGNSIENNLSADRYYRYYYRRW